MQMIYHPNGHEDVCGIKCQTKVVEQEDLQNHLNDGWYLTPWEMTQESKLDKDLDGKLTKEEATLYLESHGVEIPAGTHWKTVIKMAEDHHNGNSNE